ncbi:MAG: cytochrome b N-terminal domain-containing protein [Planctomycetota bacterium]
MRELGATPVPQAPRFGRVTGFVLAGGLALQVLTGIGLGVHYSPATTTAWGSVVHLEEQVLLGRFLRGLHAFGASAVVICLLLHLLQKAWRLDLARKLGWWLGLALVPLLSAFSLTGYLLPWDQRGYWATRVASGIMAGTPLVGPLAERVFLGGADLGTLTLTRFFTVHAVVLPLSLVALGALALLVWRREARLEEAPEATPYFPCHATRDLATWLVVALAVALLAGLVGAHLEAPADPGSDFDPRPEWYFAPLRELLKTVPEPLGSVAVPGLVFLLLAALPFFAHRRGRARAAVALPFAAWLGLLLWTSHKDLRDSAYQAGRATAAADAALARELSRAGIPPEGPGDLLRLHPPRHGRALFVEHCQRCHRVGNEVLEAQEQGPKLAGYLSLTWLKGVIRQPRHEDYFGRTKIDDMPEMTEPAALADLPRIALYVRSLDPTVRGLDPAEVAAGRAAYVKQGCMGCHKTEPVAREKASDLGANLAGYGSPAWLKAFLKDPGSPLFYCDANEMPAYAELSEQELDALVVYLRGLDPTRAAQD